jgi:hypothetical protein
VAQIRHRINQSALAALAAPGASVYRDMLRRGIRVQNGARRRVNVDTGRLRSSINVEGPVVRGGGAGVRVGTNVEYAIYVHEGTRPHLIRPQARTVLRFQAGGGTVYARWALHPGTRGNPFLRDALTDARY